MHRFDTKFLILGLVVVLSAGMLGCPNGANNGGSSEKKIPVTTASDEARKEFLQARDLSEKLQQQDSLAHYDKAISLDPNFAFAELGRAGASQTAKEFFDHLKKAVSLADKASEGERLAILATQAGADGETAKQKEFLDKLVAAFPDDERAHFRLGGYFFGQQDYAKAIEHYKKATEINESFSPVYNILGYAYRQSGDYKSAEDAFKKYIELIPDDPNPYDSYGELLLKMGKYDESIAQYRKALSINKEFVASHFGIAADLIYQGKHDEAIAELEKIDPIARSDGDRGTALFGMAVAEIDKGDLAKAVENVDKLFAMSEKRGDSPAMAGNLGTKGTILLEMGKSDEAKAAFDKSLKTIEDSDLSDKIKANAKLGHHFNMARVALAKNDLETAKTEAEEYRKGAEAGGNPGQVRASHQIAGMIALAEKDYDKAIAELDQASQQNPRNLYRLALAHQGKGDKAKANEFAKKAAEFNPLPQLNYSFIRAKAAKMAEETKAE